MSSYANNVVPSDSISLDNPHNFYSLEKKIGSGTYGDVYVAKIVDYPSERAAIKIIKIDFDKEDFDVVKQEIILMKDSKHDNIVRYYGSYIRKDKLWICMEFCSGGSLQDIYNHTGELEEKQIAYTMRETLREFLALFA